MVKDEPVLAFEQCQKQVTEYFGCDGDFFIKPLLHFEWAIKEDEDFHFLSYWTAEGKKIDAVIVKRGGKPMVYQTKKYTVVVAIDCVKIGFIFRNDKNIVLV